MRRGISAILSSIFEDRRKRQESSALPEIELSANGDSAGLYAPNVHTLIFESVLSRRTAAGSDANAARNDRESKARAGSISKRIEVGEELRIAKETVAKAGQALAQLSDAASAEYVGRLLKMTEGQLCQIAFIGQMNAGKSTLINALIGAPNLLPSEITPWTTVVTNLYFGVPNKPTSGAVFEFFNEAEWRQLSEGNGRVRALTERLIPDFSWENFHRQVENMRESAERRLGHRYRDLLGKQHAFDSLTDGVLEKYVAAESPLGEESEESSGEFSMITKAAHIYFDLTSFFYPTVLIDTPGINDPFLVRDEITRQNLERANIFVIVVTARQLLSNADLDLLRILRGLRKENFIIFVNKIDEIDDFDRHSKTITDRIRALLSREFPNIDIPVIIGCAEWAAIALGDDTAEQRKLARSGNFPQSSALLTADGAKTFWLSDPSAEAAAIAETILTRSAVPDLAVAVSNMLHSGSIAGSLRHAATALLALSRNGLARAEANAELISRLITQDGDGGDDAIAGELGLATGLDDAAAGWSSINEEVDRIQARYTAIIENTKRDLAKKLKDTVKSSLSSRGEQQANPHEWLSAPGRSTIVIGLRSDIENEFSRRFQEILSEISDVTHSVERTLSEKIGLAADALKTRIEYPHLPALKCVPSLAALGEPIATEFAGSAYAPALAKLSSLEHKRQLLGVIEAEFGAIVEKLAQSAQQELDRTTSFILDHFRSNALHPLNLIIEQRRTLIEERRPNGESGDAEARRQRCESLKIQLKQMQGDAKAYDAAVTSLASIAIGETT